MHQGAARYVSWCATYANTDREEEVVFSLNFSIECLTQPINNEALGEPQYIVGQTSNPSAVAVPVDIFILCAVHLYLAWRYVLVWWDVYARCIVLRYAWVMT
eukprot:scaffold13219_cov61-Attheya_sp.AAC.1